MGLSTGERVGGMYFSINRLSALRHRLVDAKRKEGAYPYGEDAYLQDIENELTNLWHNLLANQSNACHWLMGSDSDNLIRYDANSPWAVAVRSHMPRVVSDWKVGDPIEWQPDNFIDALRSKDTEFFDPFDNGFLTIPDLLQYVVYLGSFYEIVFLIYKELETLVYYLRRYNDELLSDFAALDKSISAIQGACFSIFCKSEDYAKAYALHNACKILFGNINPFAKDANDIVTQWAINQHLYHDIPPVMKEKSLEDICAIHLEAVQNKDNLLERMLGIMRLAGPRYYYKHEYDALCAMIKGHPVLGKPTAKSKLKVQFEACCQAHDDVEAGRTSEFENHAEESQISVYQY